MDINEVIGSFQNCLQNHTIQLNSNKNIQNLYHYTPTHKALKGLIEDKKFWFTRHDCFSDPYEHDYGWEQIDSIFKKCGGDQNISETTGLIRSKQALYYYILCLTYAGDDITMWRLYGNNGAGYCVEVEPTITEEEYLQKKGASATVEYELTSVKSLVSQFIKIYEDLQSEFEDHTKLSALLGTYVYSQAISHKMSHYEFEKEVRIVCPHWCENIFPGQQVQERFETQSDRGDIKYIFTKKRVIQRATPFNFEEKIKKIIIGPALDANKAIKNTQKLLKRNGWSDVEVIKSEHRLNF